MSHSARSIGLRERISRMKCYAFGRIAARLFYLLRIASRKPFIWGNACLSCRLARDCAGRVLDPLAVPTNVGHAHKRCAHSSSTEYLEHRSSWCRKMTTPTKISIPLQGLVEKIYPLVVVAAMWELIARLQWVDPFLPRFTGVVVALWTGLIETCSLVIDAGYTLMRTLIGFAVGGIIGVGLGTPTANSHR